MARFEIPPHVLALFVSVGVAVVLLLSAVAFAVRFFRTWQRANPPAPPTDDAAAFRALIPADVPAHVRDEIQRLGDADTAEAAAAALVAGGPDVVPHLLAALPATRDDALVRQRLLDVLGDLGDSRSREPLEALVRRGAPEWQSALEAVVSLGTRDVVPFALEVLDGYEASHTGRGQPLPCHFVYAGIVKAAEHGRVAPEFRDALLAPVVGRVGDRWPEVRPNAADAAMALDPDTAARVLVSPEILDRGADAVAAAFAALLDVGRSVEPELALSVASRVPAIVPESESQYFTFHVVLVALARSGHPRAEGVLRSFESLADERTQDSVRAAIAALPAQAD